MTMKLRLQQAIQENEYYFRGFVRMADLAELFREYPFEEETLEKAAYTDAVWSMAYLPLPLRFAPCRIRAGRQRGKTCFLKMPCGRFGMEKQSGRFEQNDRGGTGRSRGRG